MPISHHKGGTTVTGDSIAYFRLATLMTGVRAELRGMKLTRGRSCYAVAKQEFGLKGNKQKVYEFLVAKVEELRAQQEHIVEEGGRTVRQVGGQEVQ
jgi:hypothetical protein